MQSYGTPSIEVRAIKPISPLRIGWITPINEQAAQVRIRVLHVNKCLRKMGYFSNIVSFNDIIEKKYDIAIVGKVFDEITFNNIKVLKSNKKIVICDICEDIINWPWVNNIISICDKVICCSYKLEEKIKQINPFTCVIEDAYEI